MSKRGSARVLLGALLTAAAVGVANNAFNPHRVPWTGRPKLLDSGEELTDPHWKGMLQGLRYGLDQLVDNRAYVAIVVVLVIAIVVAARRLRGVRTVEIVEPLLRVAMATMFAAACYYKIRNPTEFALTVAQYRMLPASVVRPFAVLLPALELTVAAGLLLTPFAREFYALMTAMWAMFIVALTQALLRRLGITCGCFDIAGATTTGEAWFSLFRDLVLIVPTAWLAWRAPRQFFWRLPQSVGPVETTLAPD